MKRIKLDVRLNEKPGKIQRYALVDDEDFEYLNQFNWTSKLHHRKFMEPVYYAHRHYRDEHNKRKVILMHREIMNAPDDMVIDHKKHNGLDNRKSEMRVCTVRENVRNMRPLQGQTSKYKGVSWNKRTKRWRVKLTIDDRNVWLGQSFINEIEAAKIYDAAASIVYKDFAYLNFGQPSLSYINKVKEIIYNVLNRKFASKYRGVSLEEGRWRATIVHKGIKYSLGKYTIEKEAALAYNKKAKELLGDKAKLNKI